VTPRHPSPPLATPFQPETEPRRLSFGFLTQSPSSPRVSQTHNPTTTTAWYVPPCHPHAPSPVAVPHGAPETEPKRLGFGFWPKPHPRLAFCERTAPHPPPPGTCHRATPKHHPPLPFHTACPKPSQNGLVSGFGPSPLPASHFASALPPTHHHLVRATVPPPSTIPIAVLHSVP
jgi:hypothetical protein